MFQFSDSNYQEDMNQQVNQEFSQNLTEADDEYDLSESEMTLQEFGDDLSDEFENGFELKT